MFQMRDSPKYPAIAELHSEPSRTSKMELFPKIVFANSSILHVQLSSEYASVLIVKNQSNFREH